MEFTLSIAAQRMNNIDMAGMAEFGELLKRARESQGLTGVEVANRLGRPHSFVVRLERGQNANPPDPAAFDDLSRVLRISKVQMLEALGYLDSDRPDDDEDAGPKSHLYQVVDQYEWRWPEALEIADIVQTVMKHRSGHT
jgi:transcriptional regulator with XRE-family HTH domain